MMTQIATRYVFYPADHGVFAEIYFPRKSAHQGTIFDALREGYNICKVREYLISEILNIIEELKDYPRLFDPRQYNYQGRKQYNVRKSPTAKDAISRIALYESPFKGWSLYQVDGVWFDEAGKDFEEATQVVRIMFRFQSKYYHKAQEEKCLDVYRAIISWALGRQDLFDEHNLWDKKQKEEFYNRHRPWTKEKRKFYEKYFVSLTQEIQKWVDDCALFIFGYLVRQFSESVLRENLPEEEIWVASFFNLTVNVIKRVESS